MKIELLQGDCREILNTLPEQSVQTIVTSPPYYGLRNYGVDGQIGLEKTPEAYVAELAAVFASARRVLRDDGTVWLNLGDSYNGSCGTGGATPKQASNAGSFHGGKTKRFDGLKPKDLIGIPWRVAFALQADGWYLRQDIIWAKKNPMPESVTDRCTKAHEYIFLLSKSARYFYDAEAIQEKAIEPIRERERRNGESAVDSKIRGFDSNCGCSGFRNRRSVWTVATKPYSGAHFATFPPDLIRPCILAGSKPGDRVLDPFNGAGTTGLVSLELGRQYTGIELNPEYIELTRKRLSGLQPVLECVA